MPFSKFFGLISAISDKWRRTLRSDSSIHSHQKTVLQDGELSCKRARKLLIQEKFKEPLANSRLHRLGVSGTAKIRAIHRLAFSITRDTKLSMFQYKIIHNILPYGSWLHKINLSESPLCERCNELETLTHVLANCTDVRDFWNILLTWWNSIIMLSMKLEYCTAITLKIGELEFLIISSLLQKDILFYRS